MSIKGTQTEKNVLTAFVGESQARNRYTYAASQARKEGFVQIADIFEETANQEKEHAKRLFSLLEGGEVDVQASFPAGVVGTVPWEICVPSAPFAGSFRRARWAATVMTSLKRSVTLRTLPVSAFRFTIMSITSLSCEGDYG